VAYDVIIRNGTLIDGTGAPRRAADVAISAGRVAKIGDLGTATATREIDASGHVVAPGVIDVHCHYDASLNWDPYATSSSWHGVTTVVVANCGFGFAPVRPSDRERIMGMMKNTEQIPIETQRVAIGWGWETFPEWMDHLRSLPKGVNTAMYVPMNPLLIYVKGPDAAKRRTTAAERRRMREILHEAMDAGACGFSFTLLAQGNNHVDFDGSPVPSDVMEPEDAYNLAWVLRKRGEGVIQAMVEFNLDARKEVTEQLARISGQPVIHNVCVAVEPFSDNPSQAELNLQNGWQETLEWATEMQDQGLRVYLQTGSMHVWVELKADELSTGFVTFPGLEDFARCTTDEERLALAADPEFRARARDAAAADNANALVSIPYLAIADAHGDPTYSRYEGVTIAKIAEAEQKSWVDVFFELLVATRMKVDFGSASSPELDASKHEQIIRHPRALMGVSDGGAHVKSFSGGYFSTDFLIWIVREEGRLTLEEAHNILSQRPAEVFGFKDRGILAVGYAADIMIYDFEKLGFDRKYVTLYDLPDGGYRRTVPSRGVSYVLVNGEVIVEDNQTTGAHPGLVLEPGDQSVEPGGQSVAPRSATSPVPAHVG
jgi:N-acyl-D-aspartate/D-glutamate deacylase